MRRRSSITHITGKADDHFDEHTEFISSVRAFQCTLLRQFALNSTSRRIAKASRIQITVNPGWDPYIARFAQPCPVRSVNEWLKPEGTNGGEPSATDYSCAPLVCVVFQDNQSVRSPVRSALCGLASHPAGLIVTVSVLVPEASEDGEQLLFAMIGLGRHARQEDQPPREKGNGIDIDEDCLQLISGESAFLGAESQSYSKAEQRQMVWATIHEVLRNEEGELPPFLVEVYMLQDLWLYDRLFRWLQQSCGPLQSLSQDELDLLVHEYGEETATHFLFVRHYIRYLRFAAAVAVVCMLVTAAADYGLRDKAVVETGKRTFLLAFLPAWAFYFLASWRAEASKAGFRWLGSLGSVQNSVKEVARLQAMELSMEKRLRYLRVMLLSVPLMILQLLVVLAVTSAFVIIEVYLYDVAWDEMTHFARIVACVLYNLAFGIAFMLILTVFYPISKCVTGWERHPDRDVARWHLTAKIFGNWFFAVFLYFFVIAFCYIPFGDNIADVFAALFSSGTGGDGPAVARELRKSEYTIREALESFRPDSHRLAVDVMMFFVLQDFCRLMQVLVPVVRTAWGIGKMQGAQKGRRHRHKRTSIFFDGWGICRAGCKAPSAASDTSTEIVEESLGRQKPQAGYKYDALVRQQSSFHEQPSNSSALSCSALSTRSRRSQRVSTMELLPAWTPGLPEVNAGPTFGGVDVLYCYLGQVEIVASAQQSLAREEVVLFACSLASPKSGEPSLDAQPQDGPIVMSRLRVCSSAGRKKGVLAENSAEVTGDLITLLCEPGMIDTDSSDAKNASVCLRIDAEIVGGGTDANLTVCQTEASSASTWGAIEKIPLSANDIDAARTGTVTIGPIRVKYVAGLVHAATHYEALEKVPDVLKRNLTPPPVLETPNDEESDKGTLNDLTPWLWWDDELSGLYRDEVFELFAVKETFETFEIYTHLATSLSYVCLFGMAAPACPLLALFFTSVEVRQDQLRLLWLSRPPHPDKETLRFQRAVSLGAWYEIIRFTCHLSVVVNLLLWGLTYAGLGNTEEWSPMDGWRNLALFLMCQQVCFFLGGMLHRNVSALDHDTASAYLQRYSRLKQVLTRNPVDSWTGITRSSTSAPSKYGSQLTNGHSVYSCRSQLVWQGSEGVSSLL